MIIKIEITMLVAIMIIMILVIFMMVITAITIATNYNIVTSRSLEFPLLTLRSKHPLHIYAYGPGGHWWLFQWFLCVLDVLSPTSRRGNVLELKVQCKRGHDVLDYFDLGADAQHKKLDPCSWHYWLHKLAGCACALLSKLYAAFGVWPRCEHCFLFLLQTLQRRCRVGSGRSAPTQ